MSYVSFLTTDERVTLDFGKALQQARVAKSWTQKDLATVGSSPTPSYLPLLF